MDPPTNHQNRSRSLRAATAHTIPVATVYYNAALSRWEDGIDDSGSLPLLTAKLG